MTPRRARHWAVLAAAASLAALVVLEPTPGTADEQPNQPTPSPQASPGQTHTGPATDATPPEHALPMGELRGSGRTVRLEATPNGTRYTVLDHAGQPVARLLTGEQLRQRFPGLAPSPWWADDAGRDLGPIMIVPEGTP